jgi:hypothetical protein
MNIESIDALIIYFKAKVLTFQFFTDREGAAIYQLTIMCLRRLKKYEEAALLEGKQTTRVSQ